MKWQWNKNDDGGDDIRGNGEVAGAHTIIPYSKNKREKPLTRYGWKVGSGGWLEAQKIIFFSGKLKMRKTMIVRWILEFLGLFIPN